MFISNFDQAIRWAVGNLMANGEKVDTGSWQGYSTEGKPDLVTLELLNLQLEVPVDQNPASDYDSNELLLELGTEIQPNLPWADDHFEERVSRDPSNPGEAYKNWPWWKGQEEATQASTVKELYGELNPVAEEFKFDHTYQERFWPKRALMNERPVMSGPWGIRYDYGDLDDVVNLLSEYPFTRQATFPIFFPEDTGAVHGGRVPCTLHYHFLLRNNQLHMWYPIRSCDLVRHFQDDLYLACRLLLWVLDELVQKELRSDRPQLWVDVRPGTLHFTAYSFHVHMGDIHNVRT